MRPSRVLACLALLLFAAGTSPAAAGTRERGQLLEQLRTDLRDADLAVRGQRYDLASDLYLAAIEHSRRLNTPNLPRARAIDGLADLRRVEGRLEDAATLYLESSELWPRLLGERQPRLATTLHNLGAVYFKLERRDDAIEPLRRALSIFEASFGPDSPEATNTRGLYQRCLSAARAEPLPTH